MLNLKKGEETKTKNYCCVCVIGKKMTIEDIRSKFPAEEFTIQQKTPIRVLHRRTLATRAKVIHKLTVNSVNVTCPKGMVNLFLSGFVLKGKNFTHCCFHRK